MAKREFINVNNLKDGMRVAEAVCDNNGRMLIGRGTILDDYMISSMRQRGLDGVYVGESEASPIINASPKDEPVVISAYVQNICKSNYKPDRSKIALSESIKKQVCEGVKSLYSDTSSFKFTDTTRRITDDLMDAITKYDAIAFDIDSLKISDEYTFKHSVDVASIAMVMAKNRGYTEKRIYEVGLAGLLHDIGKTRIPNIILTKPGKLTDDEFEVIKNHSLFGFNILEDKKEISDAVKMAVLQHHEKTDGSGYPIHTKGDRIGEYAKMLTIADIFDALVTDRPYKSAMPKNTAVELLMSMTDVLDFEALTSFLRSVILYPVNSIVTLSTGEKAKVVKNDAACILRPTVVGINTGEVYDLANDVNLAGVLIV